MSVMFLGACSGVAVVDGDDPAGAGGATSVAVTTTGPTTVAGVGGSAQGGSAGEGGVGGQGGNTGGGGGFEEACAALLGVEILDTYLDAGSDDTWTVGEMATVYATLYSEEGDNIYPGIRVSHPSNLATPGDGTNFFFALLPDEPSDLGVTFEATQTGTTVFQIDLEHVNGACPGTRSATLSVTVE